MGKFKLTRQVRTLKDGTVVHRIAATENFKNPLLPGEWVRRGELGGWLESESNLEQQGSAWVAGEAVVKNLALVKGNALVDGFAEVSEQALVITSAHITDSAKVCGTAFVSGGAKVGGTATIKDRAWISDAASVCAGEIGGMVIVCGESQISTNLTLSGSGKYTIVEE